MLVLSNSWRGFQNCRPSVSVLTRSFAGRNPNGVFQVLDDPDGLKGAGDDLSGADAMTFFRELALEQFGIGEDHAELIVQAVEEADQFGGHFHAGR